jgi:Predicted acetyltransferase
MTIIERANSSNLEEILKLQYLAYQSEAKLLNNFMIQPLTQTLEELVHEFQNGIIYKAENDEQKIIGSVRGTVKSGTLLIGKLIVHPNFQGMGIGTKLLKYIEEEHKELRKELYTSDKSIRNLNLYEHNGYTRFKTEAVNKDLSFIFLEKLPDE